MRVIVVEDDELLGEVIARGLREEGHAVDLVSSVAEARYSLDIETYDLAVLDLGLPDGDGLMICESIKSSGVATRVLILTARDTLVDKVGGLDAGADDYLTKPFEFPELAARIRALIRRPAATGSPVLEAGDIRLDPASHRVWNGQILIPLTAREFSLMHYLMSRPGEVVTRSELIEHVWDANYDGMSNVIDVHVASLRRKLDLPGRALPLETVRGVGYRLNSATKAGTGIDAG